MVCFLFCIYRKHDINKPNIMTNILENLLLRKNENENALTNAIPLINREEYTRGNMNDLGYTRAGRNNGDPLALRNSFQLIRSGQIVDENNNEQKRNEVIESLDIKISEHKTEINGRKHETEAKLS